MADLMMPVNYTIIHDDPSRGHAISEEELHVAQAMRVGRAFPRTTLVNLLISITVRHDHISNNE